MVGTLDNASTTIGQRDISPFDSTESRTKFPVFKMMAGAFYPIFTLLVLFQAGSAARDNKSPSACHCRPVINVGMDGNEQCDLCEGNNQLLQEVNELKKELASVKDQIQGG